MNNQIPESIVVLFLPSRNKICRVSTLNIRSISLNSITVIQALLNVNWRVASSITQQLVIKTILKELTACEKGFVIQSLHNDNLFCTNHTKAKF